MKNILRDLALRVRAAYTVLTAHREQVVGCYNVCKDGDNWVIHSIAEDRRLSRERVCAALNMFPVSETAVSFEEALKDMLLTKVVYAYKGSHDSSYIYARLFPTGHREHAFQVFNYDRQCFIEDSAFLIRVFKSKTWYRTALPYSISFTKE